MSCMTPIRIRSKALNAPKDYPQYVPCGKCVGCLRDRQNVWVYRLQREQYTQKHSLFVTLTYDPENVLLFKYNYPGLRDICLADVYNLNKPWWCRYKDYIHYKMIDDVVMSVNPRELANYFKRLRKRVGCELKYFACGEYGDQFGRPHYHFVVYYIDAVPSVFEKAISDAWPFGNVEIAPLTDERITYVTKYIMKYGEEAPPDEFCLPCFQRSSQGMGLEGYWNDSQISDDGYCELTSGAKIPIPRYFRRKYSIGDVFDFSRQLEIEQQQKKKQDDKFKRYAQDYEIRNGKSTIEKIRASYIQDNDSTAIRYTINLNHKRRKGL